MAQSSVFPAFITDEYRPGSGFASFEQQARASSDRVRRQFETDFNEIQNIAQRALSAPRNASGSLDINPGRYREAAQAAQAQAQALREIAVAAERAARANGDTTEATRLYVQASRAAAIEAENVARSANQEAAAMERLQAELNQTASRTTAVIAANGQFARSQDQITYSSRASRFAMVQVGQQAQDMAVQLQSGTAISTIFVQQVSQMGFALSQMEGKLGRVGAFLAGQWGTALFLGIVAIDLLTRAFMGNTEASEEAERAASEFAQAQNDIATFFDRSTGKIREQNAVLVENAILLRQARITELRERTAGRTYSAEQLEGLYRMAGGIERQDVRSLVQNYIAQTMGDVTRTIPTLEAEVESLQSGRLSQSLRTGGGRQRRQREDNRPDQARGALEQIQRINEEWNEQPKIVDRAVAAVRRLNEIVADAREQNQPASVIQQLTAGAGAAGQAIREGLIRQIVEPFNEAPKAVQRANAAMLQLSATAANFPELGPQILEAAEAVERGLLRPYRDLLEGMVEQYDVQQLIAAGRDEEAQALRIIQQLEDRLGDIGEERRQTIRDGVVALSEQARMYDILRERQQQNLQAVGQLRTGIEDFLGSGNAGNLVSTISSAFRNLNAQVITERIFGPALRELEDFATGRTRIRQSNEQVAASLDVLRGEVGQLTDRNRDQVRSVEQVITVMDRLRDSVGAAANAVAGGVGGPYEPAGGITADGRNWQNAGSGPGAFSSANIPMGSPLDPNLGLLGATQGLSWLNSVVDQLSDTAPNAADTLANVGNSLGSLGAANDNQIDVLGRRRAALDPSALASPQAIFSRFFTDAAGRIFGQAVGRVAGPLIASAFEGASYGQFGSNLILGRGGNNIGSQLGGALGNIAGKELGKTFGEALGSLGQFAGPLGGIIGGVAGSLLFSALSSTPRASSTIGGSGGQLAVTGTTGTRSLQGQTVTAADSVISTIDRIAELLGGTYNASAGSVSIGIRDGKYRVDPTGSGITKTKKGAIDFGEDAEAAVRAAVLDLIKDGVLEGLREGTRRLLQNAKDLDTGIDKALRFEGVFTRLKERLDPVGAALDALNKEFDGLRRVFAEAGASAEELAQLEQLYALERADAIEQATERMTGALRDLLDDLTVNNDALSLRERLSLAQARYSPLAARVAAGDQSVDYDAFAEAARLVLDIQRQISGSTSPYFDLLSQITLLTQQALAGQENIISLATAATPPGQTAANTDNTPVVGAIGDLGTYLVDELGGDLQAVNDNLATMIRLLTGPTAGGPTGFSSGLGNF